MITKTGFTFEYKGKKYGMTVIDWDKLSDDERENLYKDTKDKMIIEIDKTL